MTNFKKNRILKICLLEYQKINILFISEKITEPTPGTVVY